MTYARLTMKLAIAGFFVAAALMLSTHYAFAANSADPVASQTPVPAVLGASATDTVDPIDATVDPVETDDAEPLDPAVLGVSLVPSIDPVEGDLVKGVVLGASSDENVVDPAVAAESADAVSLDPVSDPVSEISDKVSDSVKVGQMVATAALNVRVSPAVGTERVGIAFPGMVATVIGGPIEFDGFKWLQVAFENGLSGWSVTNWLK